MDGRALGLAEDARRRLIDPPSSRPPSPGAQAA